MKIAALSIFAAAWLASPAWAASIKVGLGQVPVTLEYITADMNASANSADWALVNHSEKAGNGVLSLGGMVGQEVNGWLSLGIEVGVGMPGKGFEFDAEDVLFDRPAGWIYGGRGDHTTVKYTSVPVLVDGVFSLALGRLALSLTAGVGAFFTGWNVEAVNQYWDDGTGNVDADYLAATDAQAYKVTTYESGVAVSPAINLSPSVSFAATEKDSIGLEIPLILVGKRVARGADADLVTPDRAADDNPQIGTFLYGDSWDNGPKFTVGGVYWGINLVYTRKI